jgi:hypothetical protein
LIGDGRRSARPPASPPLAISAIGDDLDGVPEIVAGPTAYRLSTASSQVWQRTDRVDGYVAIANFDDDPFAEIVVGPMASVC